MKKPVLLVMAAGMGSRYGGLKQMDPVGPNGEVIIDYSLYDARKAGFDTVVFIIKRAIEKDFKEIIGERISKKMNVFYAYQEAEDLPEGYTKPNERSKPWGTAHALMAARDIVQGPFAVINADDYYGPEAFKLIYKTLSEQEDSTHYAYAMVGYHLKNTVTENGHVARGICTVNNDGYLTEVVERTRIETYENGIHFTEDDGKTWTDLNPDCIVSMNLWGFTKSYLDEACKGFPEFLDKALIENPLKAEYYLPSVVSKLIKEDKAKVKVLSTHDHWYGVTYKEDKEKVVEAIASKIAEGLYEGI